MQCYIRAVHFLHIYTGSCIKSLSWRQCNFVIVRHFCNKILDQFVGICMHNLIECFKLTNMCALIVSSIMVTLRKILQLDGQLLIECR